jgi:hypothetical protein
MKIIEAIIEFLLSNIAFVIILAGGIFSFFKRMNDSKTTQKPNQTKRLKPKQNVSPFGKPVETNRNSVQTVQKQNREPLKNNDRYSRRLENKEKDSMRNRYQDKEELIMNTLKVEQSELKKAIIWSEILSKPKALQKRY